LQQLQLLLPDWRSLLLAQNRQHACKSYAIGSFD